MHADFLQTTNTDLKGLFIFLHMATAHSYQISEVCVVNLHVAFLATKVAFLATKG